MNLKKKKHDISDGLQYIFKYFAPKKIHKQLFLLYQIVLAFFLQMPIFSFGCSQEQKSIKWDL